MTTTITTEINGHDYKIELTGECIRISGGPQGLYIGDGIYRDGAIHDADARLGETPEETEKMYQALEQAIRDAVGPHLSADETDGVVTVIDAEGGRWFPSEEAQAEIVASPNPEATAIRICDEEPMRGEWRQ